MEFDVPVILIIALGVFLLITTFLFGGTQEARPPELPKAVIVLNGPDASKIEIGSVLKEQDGCEWSYIKVPIVAKYSAELKPGEKIDVVPFILFRGHEVKALVEGGTGPEMFSLTQDNPEFSGTLKIEHIVTSDRPVTYGSLDNEMKEGDKVLFENKASGINFTLKLADIGYHKGSSISEKLKNMNVCGGTFELECYDRQYNFDLFPMNLCEETGLLDKCQIVITNMCKSTVTITGREGDWCGAKTAKASFGSELGKLETPFEVGERIGVVFLNESCAKDFSIMGSIEELEQECSGQEFLGRYYFTGGIVGETGLAKGSQNGCK